jgi:hypothetical protein
MNTKHFLLTSTVTAFISMPALLLSGCLAADHGTVNLPVTAVVAGRAVITINGGISLSATDGNMPLMGSTSINVTSNFPGTLYFGTSAGGGNNSVTLTGSAGSFTAKASWDGSNFTATSKPHARGTSTYNVHVKSDNTSQNIAAGSYTGSLSVVLATP